MINKTIGIVILISALFLVVDRSYGHPQDEDIILDIEQGEMKLQGTVVDEEYAAALKRKRLRKLAAMSPAQKFWLYVKAGFEHIIPKGLDHILFVLGLFFSSLLLTSLLWQITAFTLAHSVTLAMAALGIVVIPGSIVEPLIALSIVWIAVENCVFKQTGRWRNGVVFTFGLLHGLGFASVLSEYGLPKNDLVPSLLAFNIGVEFGQLAVVLVAALLTFVVRHKSWYRKRLQIPLSLAIAAVGCFWLFERTVM